MREASYDRHLSEEAYVVHEILYLSFFQPIFSLYHTGPFHSTFNCPYRSCPYWAILLGSGDFLAYVDSLWDVPTGRMREASYDRRLSEVHVVSEGLIAVMTSISRLFFQKAIHGTGFRCICSSSAWSRQAGLNLHPHSFEAKALSTRLPVDICLQFVSLKLAVFISAYVLILLVFHTWSRFSGQFFLTTYIFPYITIGTFHSLSLQ